MEEVKCYHDGPVSLAQAEKYIEASLVTTAREYVAIGYWLRRIRDERLFLEEGHKNFEEYVRQKYRKDGGWASKCIKVNGQFSVGGNSPYLSEEYQGYSKYQLVELAYMTEEQRELVDTDTPVREMKQLRKPDPESQAVESAPQDAEPEPKVIHFTAGNRTIDNAYGAALSAVVGAYLDVGYAKPKKECEVAAFGLSYKVLKRQDVTVFYTDAGHTVFDVENARLEEEYQFRHRIRTEPEVVTSQVEPELEPQDVGPEPEPGSEPEQTHPEKSGKCIHRPELDCTLEEVHKLVPGTGEDCSQACCWDCTKRGDCRLECYSSERRTEDPEVSGAAGTQQMGAGAAQVQQGTPLERKEEEPLEASVRAMQPEEADGPGDTGQPELPLLKNNDLRREWIRGFHTWPVWFEVPQANEVYYRYDLEDGSSLVICEYRYYAHWLKQYRNEPELDCTGRREYLLNPGYRYLHDCESSESSMVEHLKDIQRKGKGEQRKWQG